MSSTAGKILTDICQTLRSTDAFEAVTIGRDARDARLPRAEVVLVSMDESRSDDLSAGRFFALKVNVRIRVRAKESTDAFDRLLELAGQAAESLLVDRFRSQHCRDLPTGPATQTGPVRIEPDLKTPYRAATLEIICRFESGDGQ